MRLACWLGLAVVELSPQQARAVEVRNDGFESGMIVAGQGGFCTGEIGAATLVPTGGTSYRLNSVRFLYVGATATDDLTITIWDDAAQLASPGTQLHSEVFSVTGSDTDMSEADVSGAGIVVTGPFRVGVTMIRTMSVPTLAVDTEASGPTYPGRNWVLAGCSPSRVWIQTSDVGAISGDWIIRADVTVIGGSGPDAGPGSPDAGGGPDGGGGATCNVNSECPPGMYCQDHQCNYDCRQDLDCPAMQRCNSQIGRCEAASGGDGGGCGCRAAGRGPGNWWAILPALALLGLRRRRRR